MRKSTWMAQLERALSREGMTGTEKRTVLNYYEEMYQDRLDEGAREEDIIKEFGFPEDVASSVRENDAVNASDGVKFGGNRDHDDIPTGTPVTPFYEVESEAYTRPTSQYGAPNAGSVPPSAPPPPPKNNVSAPSILRMIISIVLAIALFGAGFGLIVGGVAVIIAAFAAIAFSAGIWLIAFGVGLIIFAVGCLVFGAAIKLVKSLAGSSEGGAK